MRREISGIFLFFLLIFTLMSLLSYNPADPSFFYFQPDHKIQNLFGLLGAYIAGSLIGLFGIGAFWIPVLLLFLSIHFFGSHTWKAFSKTLGGGILLLITTGGLMAVYRSSYEFFHIRFPAGGIIGLPLAHLLEKYSNITGATIILLVLWVIGFILLTGFSFLNFLKQFLQVASFLMDRTATLISKWNERRKKSKQREELKKKPAEKKRKIEIKTPSPKAIQDAPAPKQEVFEFMRRDTGFQIPPVLLLENPRRISTAADEENLRIQSKLLEKKLSDFGVNGEVVAVTPGPVVTTFEYEPAPGVKINKIVNLTDDLALTLRAASIRIVAPIPGKAVIGIEIPNPVREMVRFKEIVVSSPFEKSKSKLTLCLGKDIVGNPIVAELEKMPHLLIAGATGSGKSVALNAMICSLLYKSTPEDVRLIIVDPKRIELSIYDEIPHLITPVVTDAKKATNALFWAVREMERRYELLSEAGARNVNQYNGKVEKGPDGEVAERLPYIVIVIDELADLMMVASRDVEVALTRLAQMARAAGIHLILATQRPSVDVLTGVIKANFPTRLSFQVSSKTDSRTILDTNGAENLLGEGDMLFLPPGTAKIQRIHGAYISEVELGKITGFLKNQKKPDYDSSVTQAPVQEKGDGDEEEFDEKYDDAVALVTKTGQASISMIQRHLRIGYNRAARIIEVMEKQGVVGPSDGVKPREVLVTGYNDMP